MTNLLWAFATFSQASPALAAAAGRGGLAMTAQEVSVAVWALATLEEADTLREMQSPQGAVSALAKSTSAKHRKYMNIFSEKNHFSRF